MKPTTALLGGPGRSSPCEFILADADDVYDSSTCNLYYIIYFIRTRIRRMHTRNTDVMIARCVFRLGYSKTV